MKAVLCGLLLGFFCGLPGAMAHDGHLHGPGGHHQPGHAKAPAPQFEAGFVLTQDQAQKTTGQGKFTFRYLPVDIPEPMALHLKGAHGGFAPNPELHGGDGSTYFSLKNVGLMRIAPDLSAIEVIGGDASFKDVNLHNTGLFREGGVTYLALPSDQAGKVYITNTSGKLIRTFNNPYGDSGKAFRVCDVEYVEGILFAANGYADNVCFTCNPFQGTPQDPAVGVWSPFRFAGAGKAHGMFGTAHGITRVPETNVFTIADRANSRIESFTKSGRYIGGIDLPAGCLPCDVDYYGKYAVVGCLKGPAGSTPAPIYILEDGNIISEINIGKDLGLPGFTHIHNAAFRVITQPDGTERFFVLAYGWNPGGFAILAQDLQS